MRPSSITTSTQPRSLDSLISLPNRGECSGAGGESRGSRDCDYCVLPLTMASRTRAWPQVPHRGSPCPGEDQIGKRRIDPRTSRTAALPRSRPPLELPAPALQHVGHNREVGPPLSREEPAHGGEEGLVGGAVAGPLAPTGENPSLMAQHADLQASNMIRGYVPPTGSANPPSSLPSVRTARS